MSAINARLGKFETADEFVDGYGQYFFRGGILLPTRQAREEGDTVMLHLQIANGETVLRAEGTVKQVRTNAEGRTVGLVLRFTRLDAKSKALVDRIMEAKRELRASGELPATPSAPARLTDTTTGQHLAVDDIGAIADALDDTFDAIFSGNVETTTAPASGEDEYLASLGDFAVASSSDDATQDEATDAARADDDATHDDATHDEATLDPAPLADPLVDDTALDLIAAPGAEVDEVAEPDVPSGGGTMMMRGIDLDEIVATQLARPAAPDSADHPSADDATVAYDPAYDPATAGGAASSEEETVAVDVADVIASYRDEETAPPTQALPGADAVAPDPADSDSTGSTTMFGMPGLDGSQPLARVGITQMSSAELAERAQAAAEMPVNAADSGERVHEWISGLTGAAVPKPPTVEDDDLTDIHVPSFGESDGETPLAPEAVATTKAQDGLLAAAARSADSAKEGEAALDDLLATETSSPLAVEADAPASLPVPAPAPSAPTGLFGKLIAWLQGLFGGSQR
jgi:uncharacterized protein (TIGR02266 family)